jgi:ATP phosphoribosyltransferase regulatory subunit
VSKPKVFEKPTGLKDYLPGAVTKLRNIENRVLNCMDKWGYSQIITPTLEFYDTVGVASSTLDRKLFKLLDQNGRTLVLRSDMTAPIARVVASLLKEQSFPLRLSYHANVFRAFEAEAGRESEFYQTGVELVGDGSSDADAEVIALAIAALQAAGVKTFKIALGHVGFLNGLLHEILHDRVDEQQSLKECLLNRDYVGYRQLLKQLDLDDVMQKELEGILRLRGGEEICAQARLVTQNHLAQQSIQHLCEIWDALKAYGVSEHVLIDLTMIGDFSYYTGMTFEGYASDLGFPVCSGGRYDNLLTQFGRPAPATGFALKTTRIMEVADKEALESSTRILVIYDLAHREEALRHANELRSNAGAQVETRRVQKASELAAMERKADGSYSYQDRLYDDMFSYV